ncbi:C2H2-type domain-containing protein [Fusarium sp. LHS14.1]|nr:C2H2-type domain-containing protein [Fusarium sp. LHS14.1]
MREKHRPKPRVESMLELESVAIYLRATTPPSTDAEDQPPAWLMENEILWLKICQRLMFLFYRLAVYTIELSWSYSEFPGRIRPPCTTMPWTIWPALIVLWGVCWMFYPSPGSSPRATELESQALLDYQLQPEEFGGELLFSLNEVDLDSSFWDPPLSEEWWTSQQASAIYNPLITTMDHDLRVYPRDSSRQPIPITTSDPTRSLTNPLQLSTAAQVALSRSVQSQSRSQRIGPVTEEIIDNIVGAASRPIPTSRLKCPDCDKVLSRHDSLKRHQQTQHNREVEEHLCPHKSCKRSRQGSGFSRPDGLRRHLKACKSRRRRVAGAAVECVDIQPDSGNETREDSQALNSSCDTRSMESPDDANNQQSSSDSLIMGLRRRLAEAKVACDRAKREYDEAQRKVANYQATIEMLEKEPTA